MNDIGNSITHLQIVQTVVIGAHQFAGTAGFGCAEELAAGGAITRILEPIYMGAIHSDFDNAGGGFALDQHGGSHSDRRRTRQAYDLAVVVGPINKLVIGRQAKVADRAGERASRAIVIKCADRTTANRLGADFARRAKFSARWQTVLIT